MKKKYKFKKKLTRGLLLFVSEDNDEIALFNFEIPRKVQKQKQDEWIIEIDKDKKRIYLIIRTVVYLVLAFLVYYFTIRN